VLTSFRGGLSTLVEALTGYHGDHLHLGCPARAIERSDRGFEVVTDSGRLPARRVVLAVPAPAAAALLGPLDPRLAEPLEAIPYAGVSVVHTAYEAQDAARVPRGFGYLTPRTARREVLGAVFVSTIFPEHAPAGQVLLRNVLGGALRPELLEVEDDELVRRVRGEHRDLLGVEAPPVFTEVERYPAALPQYRIGHLARLAALERALEAWPGLWVTGNALRGIGLADCLAKNFAQGLEEGAP
jgi:oxygen-dependent protoporphyrinogen oxidase